MGSKGIVAATSLQERRSGASSPQQSTGPPSVAKVDCVPGTETAQVTLTGGVDFADFADNFTGNSRLYCIAINALHGQLHVWSRASA